MLMPNTDTSISFIDTCTACQHALFWFAYSFSLLAAVYIAICAALCIYVAFFVEWGGKEFFKKHVTQIFGILYSTAGSMVMIKLFNATTGDVKINVTEHFSFQGASGPLLFWILMVITTCFGIRLLHPQERSRSEACQAPEERR
jgi:hypothetical protein